MAYDVFLVTVPEDFDMAKLVARRLRSLKFTVRFNQKQTEDDIFDAKDARDAGKSGVKLECLAFIREYWTDMRPLSLRKKMRDA